MNDKISESDQPFVFPTDQIRWRSFYQLATEIVVPPKYSAQLIFEEAINMIFDWVEKKIHYPIPEEARRYDDGFVIAITDDNPVFRCATIPRENCWGVRLNQPTPPCEDDHVIPGRIWTTDIALNHDGENHVHLGVQIRCIFTLRNKPPAPLYFSQPQIINDITNRYTLRDVRKMDGKPWILEKKYEINKFYDFLISPNRTLPVIVLTQISPVRYPKRLFSFTLDDRMLARTGQGLAHVVCIPSALESVWMQKVGKVWASAQGAVRIYWSKLDFQNDTPATHPIVIPNQPGPWLGRPGIDWQFTDGANGKDVGIFLLREVLENCATKNMDWSHYMFYPEIKSRQVALLQEQRKTEMAQNDAFAEENMSLQSRLKKMKAEHTREVDILQKKIAVQTEQLEEYQKLIQVNKSLVETYKSQLEQEKRENFMLRQQGDDLRLALKTKSGNSEEMTLAIPDNYEDMPEWVEKNLVGRLILHPRAIHHLNKALFQEISLVYQALILLANSYRNMRLGMKGAKEEWEAELAWLKLEYGFSISSSQVGKQGDQYYVKYPFNEQKMRFLEYHLRKGVVKEDRFCLAIYFFWDEQNKQVVVGWLPSHLDNRLT
jgi:hypothetical protein